MSSLQRSLFPVLVFLLLGVGALVCREQSGWIASPAVASEPSANARSGGEQADEKPAPSAEGQAEDAGSSCVECHNKITPGVVVDWQLSKHSRNDVGCATCHGDGHNSMNDAANARMAVPSTCAACHETQAEQFAKGKHALAWASMKAMPTAHWQPMAQVEGLKGCGGCHRIGLKTESELRELSEKGSGFGGSSCNVCHTRHLFSTDEARSPQVCRTCHMGMDHPQWEMYSSSKHGVRFLLKQSRMIPEDAAAPTCQSCHLREGTHTNKTAWGYFALRLPLPQDAEWARDRAIILQALGFIDSAGNPTRRFEVVQSGDMIRLSDDSWQAERDKMLKVCNDCHSINFARSELIKSDLMIREADKIMAEGIRTVFDLYREGVLKKPASYEQSFPDPLTFHDAPTVIEQKLFQLFLEYRMRTFQGAFHANPDYSLWYGFSGMQRCLAEIREKAADMIEARKPKGQTPAKADKQPAGKP